MQFLNKAKTLMLIAALFGFHSAFAETETSPTTVTKDVDVVGTSYTLAGTYIAGPGSKVYGDMSDKGVKVRTNKNENTTTFAVNDGYVITGITITGCANDTGKVDSAPIIVLSASVDGGENVLSEQISLPNNRTTTSPQSTVVAVTGIEAKSSITFTFDNSNVGKNYQWACTYTIEYKLAESSGGDEPIVEEITAALTNVSVELETVEGEADDILHFNFTVESNADTLYIAGLVEGYWAEVSYYCDSTESIMQGNLLPEGVNLEETPFLAVTPGEYSIAIPVAKTKDVLGLFTANRMANDSAAWGIALVTLADEYSYDSIYGQASDIVAIPAYTAAVVEPDPEPVVEKEYTQVAIINFEEEATYSADWTLGSKTTAFWGERTVGEGTSHFLNLKNTGSGNDDNTYTLSNNTFMNAAEWKLDFDFAGYNSNSKIPYFRVLSDNEAGRLIEFEFAAAWSAPVNLRNAAGDTLSTINCDLQTKDTRGNDIAVTVWHHVALEGDETGVYCTVTAADGTVEIAKVKVAESGHPTGFNLHQGNALSQWAIDDVIMSIVPVKTWNVVNKLDFEEEATYSADWTLGSKTTAFWGERTVGEGTSHFLNLKNTGSGNDDNTYTISNNTFLTADEWQMDFDFAGYNSNSKIPYFRVLSDNEAGRLIEFEFAAAWSAPVNFRNAAGDTLSTINCDLQTKDTRGNDIAVTVWHHVTLKGNASGVYCTVTAADGTEEIAEVKVAESGHPTGFNLHQGNALSQWAIDDVIMQVCSAEEIVDAPTFKVEGKVTTSNLVTMNAGGNAIYYTANGGDTTAYTEPVRIFETTDFVAWAVSASGKASDPATRTVEAGVVAVPTSTVVAVNGVNRSVALACATEGSSIEYKLAADAEYAAYTEPFSIADTTVVYAIATLNDEIVTDYVFVSDTLAATVAAGTEVAVAGVAYAKAAVADSATAEMYEAQGLTDLILTADQSSVLCTPTVTIEYAFYQTDPETDHIPAEPTLTGTIASGDTLKALPYGKVEATAKADGYVATTTSIWLKAASDLTIVKTYDFSRAAWGGHTDDLTVTIGSDAVATVNGTWLGTVTIADSLVEDFLVQTGTTWLKRSVSDGFYQFNSGGRMIGVNNVLRNQIVTIYGHAGNAALSLSLVDNGVAEADVMNTVEGSVYTYRITAPGVLALSMARYGYLDSITIAEDPAATKDVVIGINRAVGTSRFVEITCATEKSDIFYALGTETVNEIVTTTIDSTLVDTVVVVGDTLEPLLGYTYDTTTVTTYDTTIVYGEWQAYTEPVEFTTSGWIRGYATHLGDDSQPVEYYVEAGTTVQIVQPVITYTGNAEGGKTFEITVDESAVIGSVSLPIYYTLPGGEETLYEGPVTVANDVYGWLTAVSKLEGYDPSPLAYRYLDSRDSYTEKYEAVTAETTELPTEAADIEFADAPTINVSNPGAIKTSGRIYFHRTMHAGYNALVLPFAMTTANLESGAVKITDAAGNSLSGTDYTILRIQNSTDFTKADSLVAADALLHTANLVAAQTYLIKVADELVGQDIIFVSTEGNTIQHSAGNFSALAAEGAFKVVNNRTFAAVTADVQVYLLNDKGNVFVRQAAGATIPAYTPAIIADSAFTADNSQIKLFDRKYAAVYKSINSDSLFIPTQENVVAAYAEGWMCNADEANDWSSFVYVTNKKATIDPVTELELEKATVYPGVCIKNNVAKNVYFYVTNVANIKAFVLSNKTSEERTATCTATAADGETITATAASMDASAVIEMNLVGEKEYELKFEATGDMTIYAIKFKTAGLVGIEAVEIEREDDCVIYDMLGRRVQEVKAGQIYIMNGKKFMQR